MHECLEAVSFFRTPTELSQLSNCDVQKSARREQGERTGTRIVVRSRRQRYSLAQNVANSDGVRLNRSRVSCSRTVATPLAWQAPILNGGGYEQHGIIVRAQLVRRRKRFAWCFQFPACAVLYAPVGITPFCAPAPGSGHPNLRSSSKLWLATVLAPVHCVEGFRGSP